MCVGMFMYTTTLTSCLQNKKATQKPTSSQYPLQWMVEALVVSGSQVQFHSPLLLKIIRLRRVTSMSQTLGTGEERQENGKENKTSI